MFRGSATVKGQGRGGTETSVKISPMKNEKRDGLKRRREIAAIFCSLEWDPSERSTDL